MPLGSSSEAPVTIPGPSFAIARKTLEASRDRACLFDRSGGSFGAARGLLPEARFVAITFQSIGNLSEGAIWGRLPIDRMVLNRNPENYFAEIEQEHLRCRKYGSRYMVRGIRRSPDKMLVDTENLMGFLAKGVGAQ